MASGKSLELRAIQRPPPQELCRCGRVWEGPEHFTKAGTIRARVVKEAGCVPTGANGADRKALLAAIEGAKK